MVFQKGHRGWGADAFGVIILIKGGAHVKWLAVQEHLPALCRERPKAEGMAGAIHGAVFDQGHFGCVKCGVVGRPKLRRGDIQHGLNLLRAHGHACGGCLTLRAGNCHQHLSPKGGLGQG